MKKAIILTLICSFILCMASCAKDTPTDTAATTTATTTEAKVETTTAATTTTATTTAATTTAATTVKTTAKPTTTAPKIDVLAAYNSSIDKLIEARKSKVVKSVSTVNVTAKANGVTQESSANSTELYLYDANSDVVKSVATVKSTALGQTTTEIDYYENGYIYAAINGVTYKLAQPDTKNLATPTISLKAKGIKIRDEKSLVASGKTTVTFDIDTPTLDKDTSAILGEMLGTSSLGLSGKDYNMIHITAVINSKGIIESTTISTELFVDIEGVRVTQHMDLKIDFEIQSNGKVTKPAEIDMDNAQEIFA